MVLSLEPEQIFTCTTTARSRSSDHFDVGGDPLSIVLLIETSNHVEPMLPAIQHVGAVFTEAVMGHDV